MHMENSGGYDSFLLEMRTRRIANPFGARDEDLHQRNFPKIRFGKTNGTDLGFNFTMGVSGPILSRILSR